MSFTKQVAETIQSEVHGKKSKDYAYSAIFRQKVEDQRKLGASVTRVEKPSNLPRARGLGYKAKNGFLAVLVRIRKGSGMHVRPVRGRRPKRMGVSKLTRRLSKQTMAEQRAGKKYPNCEVLNSYWVGEDGKRTYYEVLLVDVSAPEVIADRERNWITFKQHSRRADRGLTSSGKKGRGLYKGKGHEKNFPSQRAHKRTAK